MNRRGWSKRTDAETTKRRAGGRRRYNAMRRRRAETRREAIAELLIGNLTVAYFTRGLPGALAKVFGVHPTTIWRDLQLILYGGRTIDCYRGDEFLYSVTRAYPGGPILSVEDPDGDEIRGERQKRIIKSLPRFLT